MVFWISLMNKFFMLSYKLLLNKTEAGNCAIYVVTNSQKDFESILNFPLTKLDQYSQLHVSFYLGSPHWVKIGHM